MPDTGETHFPRMCAYFLVDVNPDELEEAVPVTCVPAVCASGCLTRERAVLNKKEGLKCQVPHGQFAQM